VLSVEDLPFNEAIEESAGGKRTEEGVLHRSIEDLERKLIVEAMEKSGDHQSRAAAQLGISERMLRYKLKKYGLKS
jgi:transcriptional regulator with PAS, ATPase and Fis domain